MPRCLVLVGVLMVSIGCASTPQSATHSSPVGQATAAPSAEASPSPSPSPPDLKIAAAAYHAGEMGFGYAPAKPAATGGTPPYSWSVAGGALPAGLTMDAFGTVSGTPGALGTFLFTVQVTDSGGDSATIDTTINVVQRLTVSPTCPTNFPCMVEAGCVTVCGGFGNQQGGMPPYSYRVVGGVIPTAMGLNGLALVKAFPAPAAGTTKDWLFTVRVTDGLGATAQTTAKFHVFPHIAFTSPIPSCTGATNCTATLTYTGGTPGLVSPPSITTPQVLPGGGTLSTNKGTATLTIPKCQTPGTPYNTTLTIVLVDGSQCGPSGGQYCSTGPVTVKVSLTC